MRVILDQRGSNGLWLSASVTDTGSGITAAEQEKLFQPFSRAVDGHNTQEGTGLGLPITRQFARLMGGDVTVASSSGKGSTFRLEIPVEPGDAAVAVRRSAPRRVIGIQSGQDNLRILVVDDQFENRDWLMKLLAATAFSVRGADNGETGVRGWEEWNPRLILMDVHMPVIDGLEATRRIKAAPRGKETVVVVLTASAMVEDRKNVVQSGADAFLSKPCREDELFQTIGAQLNITYAYEEVNAAHEQRSGGIAAMNPEKLSQLPRELLDKLRNATSTGNKKPLDSLILKVRDCGDIECADALLVLASAYEYDALTQALEEACLR